MLQLVISCVPFWVHSNSWQYVDSTSERHLLQIATFTGIHGCDAGSCRKLDNLFWEPRLLELLLLSRSWLKWLRKIVMTLRWSKSGFGVALRFWILAIRLDHVSPLRRQLEVSLRFRMDSFLAWLNEICSTLWSFLSLNFRYRFLDAFCAGSAWVLCSVILGRRSSV